MRGIGLIVALILAAAAGAAVMYFFKPGGALQPLFGGPGNGVVTCPGNASCPAENRRIREDRIFHGIIVPDAAIQSGAVELCTGASNGHCPADYVGYLVRHIEHTPAQPGDPKPVKSCNPSVSGFCQTNNVWAVYCRNSQSPKKPTSACDVLPELSDPKYKP